MTTGEGIEYKIAWHYLWTAPNLWQHSFSRKGKKIYYFCRLFTVPKCWGVQIKHSTIWLTFVCILLRKTFALKTLKCQARFQWILHFWKVWKNFLNLTKQRQNFSNSTEKTTGFFFGPWRTFKFSMFGPKQTNCYESSLNK